MDILSSLPLNEKTWPYLAAFWVLREVIGIYKQRADRANKQEIAQQELLLAIQRLEGELKLLSVKVNNIEDSVFKLDLLASKDSRRTT